MKQSRWGIGDRIVELGLQLMLLGVLSTSVVSHAQSSGTPALGGTPAPKVSAGQNYVFTPTVTVPEGQSYSLSVSSLPAWATFDSATGRLQGRPAASAIGTYSGIRIVLRSGQHFVALPQFAIEVVAANSAPSIVGTPPGSVTVGRSYSFTPSASDPEGATLTYSIANKPAWASFSSATGRLSGSPDAGRVGTYSNIVVTVSDGQANASLGPFAITVVGVNAPPKIAGAPPGSVTVGKSFAFRPTASDPEGAALTFSIVNKPAWAGFSSSTGRLYGTPGSRRVGTYSGIRISVSDGESTVSLPEFSITVAAAVATGSATVSWSPPSTYEDGTPIVSLAGYRIVYGSSPSNLSKSVNIPSPAVTSARIEALAPGPWYFAVKAYTAARVESDLSKVAYKLVN